MKVLQALAEDNVVVLLVDVAADGALIVEGALLEASLLLLGDGLLGRRRLWVPDAV